MSCEEYQMEIMEKQGALDGSTPRSIREAFARFVYTPLITGEDFKVEPQKPHHDECEPGNKHKKGCNKHNKNHHHDGTNVHIKQDQPHHHQHEPEHYPKEQEQVAEVYEDDGAHGSANVHV